MWIFRHQSNIIQKILIFLLSVGVCFLPGIFGSIYTATSVTDWYMMLEKPMYSPPNWLFGPVWTLLYIMMGMSLYRIVSRGLDKPEEKNLVVLFLAHLLFNGIWSYLFFGLQSPLLGLVGIVVLWGFVAALVIRMLDVDRKAAMLLVPYFLWVSFAAVLNYNIWLLNLI